jgi:hypothetical protein
MKAATLLSASIITAVIIYAFANRYGGFVVRNTGILGGDQGSSIGVVDHWTGKVKYR